MGLLCLVYGKNAGVMVFYGWVVWRRDCEGKGPEGHLRFAFFLGFNGFPSPGFRFAVTLLILRCDSNNGGKDAMFLHQDIDPLRQRNYSPFNKFFAVIATKLPVCHNNNNNLKNKAG
ncbi:hypothetical protein NC652_037250 [Populus alba x Populus x berolinensis]|nr:hypothetical protein NC652_037250 [Populus alba x Populus x berolinensis]